MSGRASTDTSPRSIALVRVTLFTEGCICSGALFLSTLKPPLAAAGSIGAVLCLVLED